MPTSSEESYLRSAEAISGNQWQSVAISGNQWQSVAISGNQRQSAAGEHDTQRHSEALEAIRALRVPLGEARGLGGLLRADGLRQISKGGWVRQIEIRARKVLDDPRDDWVLSEVVERAAGERVEPHEVVEVGDAPALPVVEQLLVTCLERIANEVDVVGSRREGGRSEGDEPLVHTTARLAICEREEVGRPPAEEELEGDPAEEVAAGEYLMTEAIRRHQTSSDVIRGHQRSSEVIGGGSVGVVPLAAPRPSTRVDVAPGEGGSQTSSEVIRGHPRSSEVIRGHQRSSEVIRPSTHA